MINYKILLKALGFMFLPTVSVLSLILIGFFSWSKFISFITSDSGFAMFIRVALAVAELIFVYLLYQHYEKEEILKNPDTIKTGNKIKNSDYNSYEYNYFGMSTRGDSKFSSYKTSNPDIIILERH